MINKIVKQQTKKNKKYKDHFKYTGLTKDYLLIKACYICEYIDTLQKMTRDDDKLLDNELIKCLFCSAEDFINAVCAAEKLKHTKDTPKHIVQLNKLYNFRDKTIASLDKKWAFYKERNN